MKSNQYNIIPSVFLFWVFALILFSASLSEAREMKDYPVVKLQSLDKITARTMTFEANVGSTVKFGSLYIKIQSCRKSPPVEEPEAASFMQIWETPAGEEPVWVFSGWMFASSPGLSSMDHPIYDVWVLDCLEEKSVLPEEKKAEQDSRQEGEISDEGTLEKPDIEVESLE